MHLHPRTDRVYVVRKMFIYKYPDISNAPRLTRVVTFTCNALGTVAKH